MMLKVIGIGVVLVVAGLMVYIVPKVIQVFESSQVQLPAMTQVLISMSQFLANYGIYLMLFILLLVIGFLALRHYPPFRLALATKMSSTRSATRRRCSSCAATRRSG